MAQGAPKPGEKYRHFKNNLYQVITVAQHSETGERMVVYQALYGDFKTYARPLSMFISEVDREKYPGAMQRYRFMLMEEAAEPEHFRQEPLGRRNSRSAEEDTQMRRQDAPAPGAVKTESVRYPQKKQEEKEKRTAAEEPQEVSAVPGVSAKLMDFYDADTYEKKYQILIEMREEMTDTIINNMAVVLDVVIPEGKLDDRFEELKRCLRTYQKYETSRLY